MFNKKETKWQTVTHTWTRGFCLLLRWTLTALWEDKGVPLKKSITDTTAPYQPVSLLNTDSK